MRRARLFSVSILAFLWPFMLDRLAADTLSSRDVVAICGDSITEQKIYSVFLESYFLMCQPAPHLRAHQIGSSGETAEGLQNRMKYAVLPFNPTVVTTCYGMNDGDYSPGDPERQRRYRDATAAIVRNFKEGGVRLIVVGSPGVVDSDTYRPGGNPGFSAADYNSQTLADLTRIAKEVAAAEGVAFADLHTPMTEVMAKMKAKYGAKYHLAGADGIHPAANGHFVMAYAFLKALGCTGEIGVITCDLAAQRAIATTGHEVIGCAEGTIAMESTRYPFCFFGKTEDPNSARGVLEFLPFNEELNRLQLIVKNPGAERLKITWGKETKSFTASQLAAGINLAAEFLDNPFCEPFAGVENAVRRQQEFETAAVKSILQMLPEWRKQLPEAQGSLDEVRNAVIRRANALQDAARAAVVPVKHSIKIEPERGKQMRQVRD